VMGEIGFEFGNCVQKWVHNFLTIVGRETGPFPEFSKDRRSISDWEHTRKVEPSQLYRTSLLVRGLTTILADY
jgi:hypothetical protein